MDDLSDFIKNVDDPKLKKYLKFRYSPDYKKRLEQEIDINMQEHRNNMLSDIENKRIKRGKPK